MGIIIGPFGNVPNKSEPLNFLCVVFRHTPVSSIEGILNCGLTLFQFFSGYRIIKDSIFVAVVESIKEGSQTSPDFPETAVESMERDYGGGGGSNHVLTGWGVVLVGREGGDKGRGRDMRERAEEEGRKREQVDFHWGIIHIINNPKEVEE